MCNYIGKYVCYQALDGSATFGRIKDETVINTMSGEQPAFIVEDRYTQILVENIQTYRQWYPNMDVNYTKVQTDTGNTPSKFKIKRIKGDSLVRLSSIDLEKNIIDPKEFLDNCSTEEIFMALVVGRDIAEGDMQDTPMMEAISLGLMYVHDREDLKEELKKRIE